MSGFEKKKNAKSKIDFLLMLSIFDRKKTLNQTANVKVLTIEKMIRSENHSGKKGMNFVKPANQATIPGWS